jgi:hypothetical protein
MSDNEDNFKSNTNENVYPKLLKFPVPEKVEPPVFTPLTINSSEVTDELYKDECAPQKQVEGYTDHTPDAHVVVNPDWANGYETFVPDERCNQELKGTRKVHEDFFDKCRNLWYSVTQKLTNLFTRRS